jgi:hypothetical protein
MVCTAPNGRIIGDDEVKKDEESNENIDNWCLIRDFSPGRPRHAAGMVLSKRIVT